MFTLCFNNASVMIFPESNQQQWEESSAKEMAGQTQIPSSTKNKIFLSSSLGSTSISVTMNRDVNDWKPQLFPYKMYDLLEDAEKQGFEDIVSWTCSGTAFKIHNRRAFEKKIMPSYFPNMNSYKSFRRQLNFYGIYQDKSVQDRPDNGKLVLCLEEESVAQSREHFLTVAFLYPTTAYSHEFFVRGRRYLCECMERMKQGPHQFSKVAKGSKPMKSKSSCEPTLSSQAGCAPLFQKLEMYTSTGVVENSFTQSASVIAPNSTQQLAPAFINSSSRRRSNTGSRLHEANGNIYQSFMNQEWDDLPFDMSPSDVVAEIIATFRNA
jgi:hypothetical protein